MSLKKGLALLMVATFGLGSLLPANAAVTISSTNTTSSALEAYVLPGNSTASSILTQNVNATASSTEAAKNLTTTTLSTVANVGGDTNTATLASTVAAAGQTLYTTLQPAFTGSNQTQNWNVVVCEKTANGFAGEAADGNGLDLFFALPSGWDLNLENGAVAVVSTGKIFTTAVSNGISLVSAVVGDVQEKTSALRAGIAVHISDSEIGGTASTTTTNRDCFAINIQHENVIAPSTASSTAAVANMYTFNGTTTLATTSIIPAAGSTSTDLTFAPSILDSAVTVALANGSDLVSSFIRTGSTLTTSTDVRTQAEKLTAGAIKQSGLGTQSSVLRYRATTAATPIPGLVISESHVGAWNLMNGPSAVRPASTLVNGSYAYTANADTLVGNGTHLTVSCENTNGSTATLTGTPVVTVLGTDIDVDSTDIAAAANGEFTLNLARRTGSLVDPNTVASRLLVTGLSFATLSDSAATTLGTVECRGKIRRLSQSSTNGVGLAFTTAGNGMLLETLASAEATTNGSGLVSKFIALFTNNGEALGTGGGGQQVYQKWARSQGLAGTTEAIYSNVGTGTNNGNAAFFSTFTGTSIGSASVRNATTALKTVKTATDYSVTLADLPTASSATGDTDKLATVTIAQNSLSPGLPVTLTGATTNDGPADSVTGLADSTGSVTLAIRSKSGGTLTLTAPTINTTNGNGTLSTTAVARTITPSFTSTAITSELDGADGFVQRGSLALLVFTVTTANTVGFTFTDVIDDVKVNGQPIVRFGTTNKYAALVKPGSGSFNLTVTVGDTDLTKAITLGTAFTAITTTSFPAHGKMTLADQRSSKNRFVFSAARNKFLDSVRVFEVDGDGVVTESNVTLAAKKTKAIVTDASDDTEYVCITSARQTDCFNVGD